VALRTLHYITRAGRHAGDGGGPVQRVGGRPRRWNHLSSSKIGPNAHWPSVSRCIWPRNHVRREEIPCGSHNKGGSQRTRGKASACWGASRNNEERGEPGEASTKRPFSAQQRKKTCCAAKKHSAPNENEGCCIGTWIKRVLAMLATDAFVLESEAMGAIAFFVAERCRPGWSALRCEFR